MSYGFANKQDTASGGSESADMPILCESCLGPNPYVRMTRIPNGGECKICTRPFTVFRWSPGSGARFKRTEICTTCAKIKNVCQTCVLDLVYHLPVQVRDTAMDLKNKAPTGDINRQYYVNNVEAQGDSALVASSAGPSSRAGQDLLKKLTRNSSEPSYKRNRPQLCSFFAKGNCTRGDACPYRHELPPSMLDPAGAGDLGKQNIQDRYHGRNDPVAKRLLAGSSGSSGGSGSGQSQPLPPPPADPSVVTLFLSTLPESATASEAPIRALFSASHTQEAIRSITLVPKTKCAFVNFSTRTDAERAAAQCRTKMRLPAVEGGGGGGEEIRVSWGRSRAAAAPAGSGKTAATATATGQDAVATAATGV
ncbi:Pre-mRNA-splicing factor slt11 [Tilletia horrida]|nr:Pre-mRNA-splicing factor slt11 [Tilletia horrida]